MTTTAADAGLICGWRFFRDSAEPAEALTAHSAAEWLATNPPVDNEPRDSTDDTPEAPRRDFLWLHFNLSNAHSLRWLERLSVDPVKIDALRDKVRRARAKAGK